MTMIHSLISLATAQYYLRPYHRSKVLKSYNNFQFIFNPHHISVTCLISLNRFFNLPGVFAIVQRAVCIAGSPIPDANGLNLFLSNGPHTWRVSIEDFVHFDIPS